MPGNKSVHKTIKLLFASSEVQPLVKTGGLADVCGSLPIALDSIRMTDRSRPTSSGRAARAVDIRVILPGYRSALDQMTNLRPLAWIKGTGAKGPVRLLEGKLPDTRVKVWLIDAPEYFDRDGKPYTDTHGKDWPDNALRYTIFSRAVTSLALGHVDVGWQPDLVHCHDWQTGLVPALLSLHHDRPATVFTIHNLAYQGVYSAAEFQTLGLPPALWTVSGLEYHGMMSFLKGGLAYADWLNTVSPTYAQEICTTDYGFGLEGLLNHRRNRLTGIMNGVDYKTWDPAFDPLISKTYTIRTFPNKLANKDALQQIMGLPRLPEIPVFGVVSRLVWQKGIDLIIEILPKLIQHNAQIVVLGSGEHDMHKQLESLAKAYPNNLAVRIGYDESLAHQIEAGADMFLMPSRYEPCGLNQIYSLRYGTVPIVRRTGGLADSVIDVSDRNFSSATGFMFADGFANALFSAVERALTLYQQPEKWRQLAVQGMKQDFSWEKSALKYIELYNKALESRDG